MKAALRSIGVSVAGAGLVLGSTQLGDVDLSGASRFQGSARAAQAAGARAAATADSAVPVSSATAVCPGPESLGVEGLDGAAHAPGQGDATGSASVNVRAVTAPPVALPAQLLAATSSPPGSSATSPPAAAPPTGVVSITSAPTSASTSTAATRTRAATVSATAATASPVLATATGALAPGLAAAQWGLVSGGTARGLAAVTCTAAAAESWLVAGGGQAGRRERLVLSNPGPNAVSVDVEVLGRRGRVVAPGARDVAVAAAGRTVLLLDAVAGVEAAPIVHVTAHGGAVAAVLQDSWLDGVVPRGVDDAVSLTEPGREQVVPGVALSGAGFVRVGVPGAAEAVVQLRALTEAGPRPLTRHAVVRIDGRSTRDIALSGLPEGVLALQIRADRPVVAGAFAERRASPQGPADFAWSAAAPSVVSVTGMPLPAPSPGMASVLTLAAPGGKAVVRVTTVDSTKATSTVVDVDTDAVANIRLPQASSVWVSPLEGRVRAAVVTTVTTADGPLISASSLPDIPLVRRVPRIVPLP